MARGRDAILKKKDYLDDSTCIIHNRNVRSLVERMAINLPKSELDLEEMQIECKEIIESGDSQQKKTGKYSNTTKVARHGGKSSFSVGNVHGE